MLDAVIVASTAARPRCDSACTLQCFRPQRNTIPYRCILFLRAGRRIEPNASVQARSRWGRGRL